MHAVGPLGAEAFGDALVIQRFAALLLDAAEEDAHAREAWASSFGWHALLRGCFDLRLASTANGFGHLVIPGSSPGCMHNAVLQLLQCRE